MALHPFLDHPGPIPFAHRGGASEAPENTMPAFAHAVSLGYRYIETDVHATSDGVVVAFHDTVLDRVTDRTGPIASQTWAEVSRALVDGREPIPRLDELLATWPDLRINIDPKSDGVVGPLIEAIRRTRSLDRVAFGSFSDRRLRRMRRSLGPETCTSIGPVDAVRLALSSRRVPVGRIGHDAAQLPVRQGRVPIVTRSLVDAAHARGMHVHVWTVDDPAEMHTLLDLGVDGIMTDRPAILRDVLTERGEWH